VVVVVSGSPKKWRDVCNGVTAKWAGGFPGEDGDFTGFYGEKEV